MPKKTRLEIQHDRLTDVLRKHRPDLIIMFEPKHKIYVWFRIVDAEGKTVAEMPVNDPVFPPETVENIKREDKLWDWIQQFAIGGKL